MSTPFDVVKFEKKILAEVDTRIEKANSAQSKEFEKRFAENAAKQLDAAKGIDSSNFSVRPDAAVWSDGTERFIYVDPDGLRTPISVEKPPIVHPNWTQDAQGNGRPNPDPVEVRAKIAWLEKYLPDLKNQTFEVLMQEGEQDGAEKHQHQQAKIRLYELTAKRSLVLPKVLGQIGGDFQDQLGTVNDETVRLGGGGEMKGSTDVKVPG